MIMQKKTEQKIWEITKKIAKNVTSVSILPVITIASKYTLEHTLARSQTNASNATLLQLCQLCHTIKYKPYTCEQCSYASNQRGNLRSHMKTHGNENSFKCSSCNYSSHESSKVEIHAVFWAEIHPIWKEQVVNYLFLLQLKARFHNSIYL